MTLGFDSLTKLNCPISIQPLRFKVVSKTWVSLWEPPQLLYLHLALMLLLNGKSFENSLDTKLTAMKEIKQLLKEFERFAYGQSLSSAFTDLLDWTLLPF